MNLLYCSGGLESYRESLRKAGGVEAVFPGNIDILPYLRKNDLCFYIDSGCLNVQIQTSTLEVYEPISYIGGSLLFEEMICMAEWPVMHFQLIPSPGGVKGLILPKRNLEQRCCRSEEIRIKLFRMVQRVACVHAANTVLFHQGDGINRVCNYLWIYDAAHLENGDIPYITQARIAHKTMLSKSQVTRVLNQLRQEHVIETSYRIIRIIDRERIEGYLSFGLLETENNK